MRMRLPRFESHGLLDTQFHGIWVQVFISVSTVCKLGSLGQKPHHYCLGMFVTMLSHCLNTCRTSQGAVVIAGVPRVSTCADLAVCSCCVVDAAVAVAGLRVAYLWHGARVRVPVTVAGHAHTCRFK